MAVKRRHATWRKRAVYRLLRKIIEDIPGYGLAPIAEPSVAIVPDGNWNVVAGDYHGTDYYLFYFGMHQPRFRNFRLPEGQYRVDVIDTWNMTINIVEERATGTVCEELPRKKYLAVRIMRNATV